jgi:hypothetical protein
VTEADLGTLKNISMNRLSHGAGGRMFYRESAWLRHLVIISLGAMIFSMLCLFPGCGSDSSPKGAASAKKEKPKSDGAVKAITPLLLDKEVGTAPPLQPGQKHPLSLTPEEIEAKRREAAARLEKLDPKREIIAGITLEQWNAKLEAERAKKPNPNLEPFPGLTQRQLESKREEAAKRAATRSEVLPGLTAEQAKAGAEQAKQRQEAMGSSPGQVFSPTAPQPDRKNVK